MAEENNAQDPFKQESENFTGQSSPQSEGPQFDLDKKESWLSKYGSSIILPIVAILILAGGIYLYATQKEEETRLPLEENADILDEEIIDLSEEESTPEEETIDLTETEENSEEEVVEEETGIEEIVPETRRENSAIVVTSAEGDGITHLARRALAEYLKEHPQEGLTHEHKVYIEDYMQNRTGDRHLEVGEDISFSESLIKEAINASLQLTQEQLQGLERYSASVNWTD